MNCPKCNTENDTSARFCKNCGWDLSTISISEKKENYTYFGFLALFLISFELLWKIYHKLFLIIWGNRDRYEMYASFAYRATDTFLNLLWFGIPILIALKVKNVSLKMIIIILSSLFFIYDALNRFDIVRWNNFWYQP